VDSIVWIATDVAHDDTSHAAAELTAIHYENVSIAASISFVGIAAGRKLRRFRRRWKAERSISWLAVLSFRKNFGSLLEAKELNHAQMSFV
jgi:hypothetical protein